MNHFDLADQYRNYDLEGAGRLAINLHDKRFMPVGSIKEYLDTGREEELAFQEIRAILKCTHLTTEQSRIYEKLSEKNMATDYISAILESSRGIALLYHKKRGTVTLPTGKVDSGETPEQACRREMLEELGVKVTHMTLAHTTKHRSPKGNPYIGWHFICNFEGHLVNCEKQKHEIVIKEQLRWTDAWDVLASKDPA